MTKDEIIKALRDMAKYPTVTLPRDCEALRMAADLLAQPEQEPVALQRDVIVVNLVREGINKHRARELAEHFSKHTTPPQRTWVGLTDEEIEAMWPLRPTDSIIHFARAIEAKLRSKNENR